MGSGGLAADDRPGGREGVIGLGDGARATGAGRYRRARPPPARQRGRAFRLGQLGRDAALRLGRRSRPAGRRHRASPRRRSCPRALRASPRRPSIGPRRSWRRCPGHRVARAGEALLGLLEVAGDGLPGRGGVALESGERRARPRAGGPRRPRSARAARPACSARRAPGRGAPGSGPSRVERLLGARGRARRSRRSIVSRVAGSSGMASSSRWRTLKASRSSSWAVPTAACSGATSWGPYWASAKPISCWASRIRSSVAIRRAVARWARAGPDSSAGAASAGTAAAVPLVPRRLGTAGTHRPPINDDRHDRCRGRCRRRRRVTGARLRARTGRPSPGRGRAGRRSGRRCRRLRRGPRSSSVTARPKVAIAQGRAPASRDDLVELVVRDLVQSVGDPDVVGPVVDGHQEQGVVDAERVLADAVSTRSRAAACRRSSATNDHEDLDAVTRRGRPRWRPRWPPCRPPSSAGRVGDGAVELEDVLGAHARRGDGGRSEGEDQGSRAAPRR